MSDRISVPAARSHMAISVAVAAATALLLSLLWMMLWLLWSANQVGCLVSENVSLLTWGTAIIKIAWIRTALDCSWFLGSHMPLQVA